MKKALAVLILPLAVVACGGAADDGGEAMPEAEPAMETPIGTVTITSPAEGEEVDGASVTIVLETTVTIAPAGDMTANTGHHHVYLDADLDPAGVPIPTVENSILHKGDGSNTFEFTNLAPGEHRAIAVVADGVHVPLMPWVVDTVTFIVR